MRACLTMFAILWCANFVALSNAEQAKTNSVPQKKLTWYNTQPIEVSFVQQKKTMQIDVETGVKLFDPAQNEPRLSEKWRSHLPQDVEPAREVMRLSDLGDLVRPVDEPKPLKPPILGFDQKRVRVVFARHVGNYLWHWCHAVEADLMIQRSDEIDARLNMKQFTEPFTRTVQGVKHGDSTQQVHKALGPADAHRSTQAESLSWDYYFGKNITIEYKHTVFQIIKGVPKSIRNRSTDNPMVRYQDSEQTSR